MAFRVCGLFLVESQTRTSSWCAAPLARFALRMLSPFTPLVRAASMFSCGGEERECERGRTCERERATERDRKRDRKRISLVARVMHVPLMFECRFRVRTLKVLVWGLGFGVLGLGFGVWVLGFRV